MHAQRVIDHAIQRATKDTWLNPGQDRQVVFRMKPLTGKGGTSRYFDFGYRQYHLPDASKTWAIYDLGQLSAMVYGIDKNISEWTSLVDVCNNEDIIINMHANQRHVHLGTSFVMKGPDRNTLLAVEYGPNQSVIESGHDMIIRFYSNAWLGTPEGNSNQGVEITSYIPETEAETSNILAEINVALSETDKIVMVHINGFYHTAKVAADLVVGDTVDIIRDHTGVGFYDLNLSEVTFYHSDLDNKRKYLLLAPDNGMQNQFFYFDDVEMYICNNYTDSGNNIIAKGVIYDSFNPSDVRQVTHRDHSIDTNRVKDIIVDQEGDVSLSGAFIRVFLRTSMTARPLPADGNLIDDLYLFSLEERKKFMVGTLSVIPEWTANNLESSAYVTWMGLQYRSLSLEKLKDVYSYHGLRDLMELPVIIDGNIITPPIVQGKFSYLWYDNQGLFTSKSDHEDGEANVTVPFGAVFGELLPGIDTDRGTEMEKTSLYNDPAGAYAEQHYWEDDEGVWHSALETTDYVISNDTHETKWLAKHGSNRKIKRMSDRFHTRNHVNLSRIELALPLHLFKDDTTPFLPFETGRVDVILNNRKLIRNLDYVVTWPYVRVTNVEYIIDDTTSVMTICHGLLEDSSPVEHSFVKYGLVNYGGIHRLSYNRTNDVSVDGYGGLNSSIRYSERRNVIMNQLIREGAPYSIQRPVNHISIFDHNTLTDNREDSLIKESAIEDFLTLHSPETVETDAIVITNRHEVISLAMYSLVLACQDGTISGTGTELSKEAAAVVVLPWIDDINNDIGSNDDLEWGYIELAVHGFNGTMNVTQWQYYFLTRVNEIYFSNRISLNTYLTISG